MSARYELTSASQVEAFWRCERYWYNKSVLKHREAFSPAAAKGTRVHKAGEIYLSTGTPGEVPPEEQPILDALIAALPMPDPRFLVEHEFLLPTYAGGPGFKGFIDFMDPRVVDGQLTISDTKTRSDLRYAKKPSELAVDIQLISYAKFAISNYPADKVLLQHLYVHTKPSGRKPNKKCKTLLVDIVVTRKHVEEEWAKILLAVQRMQNWFEKRPESAKPLTPKTTSCEMYGGCSFKPLCGLVPKGIFSSAVVQISTAPKEKTDMPTLAEKLAAKAAAKASSAPPPAAPPKAAAPPPKPAPAPAPAKAATDAPPKMGLAAKLAAKNAASGTGGPKAEENVAKANGTPLPAKTTPKAALLPPDAPPETKNSAPLPDVPEAAGSEEEDETDEAPSAPTKKPKAPKKKGPSSALLDAASDDEPPVEDHTAGFDGTTEDAESTIGPTVRPDNLLPPAGTVEAAPEEGFVLYIGCIPVKGDQGFVMFEDWFRPIADAVAEGMGVADFRIVDFGKWKGPLANLIRIAVNDGNVPPVMIISSFGPGVTEATDILIPFARRVVRAFKG